MAKAYKMSASQKRIFVLDQLSENSTVYNIPMLFEIKGNVDRVQLEKAFNKLIIRHELLRTYLVNKSEHNDDLSMVKTIGMMCSLLFNILSILLALQIK